jgi:hypothetical protein
MILTPYPETIFYHRVKNEGRLAQDHWWLLEKLEDSAPFSPDEDERRGPPGGLEKSLEGVLFLPFHLETISLGIFTDADQPDRLFSFSGDAAPVHKKEDPRWQAKISRMRQCQMSPSPF